MYVKNLVLGLGIVVVFALVLWQGIEAFYPSPVYDKFCNQTIFAEKPYARTNPQSCFTYQKILNNESNCYAEGGQPVFVYDVTGCAVDFKECNFCNKEFETAELSHSKIVFVISLVVAILAVLAGYFVLSIEPVGSALIGSGIWAIFFGTVVNWRNFTNIWRFLLLLVVLVFLVWIAIKLNRQLREGKKIFRRKL